MKKDEGSEQYALPHRSMELFYPSDMAVLKSSTIMKYLLPVCDVTALEGYVPIVAGDIIHLFGGGSRPR